MREDAMEYPLVTYNKLSKSSQKVFTFLMQNRDSGNEQKVTNVEIAERIEKHPQHISTSMKSILELDMIRKGKFNLVMINPNMWFFGDEASRQEAICKWDILGTS